MAEEKRQLKQIKRIINRMEGEAGADEIIMEIQQVIPSKVKYITQEPKNSPEKLEYMRKWREERKKRLALVAKGNKKDDLNRLKIEKALKRDKFFCFTQCKKSVIVDPSQNTHTIEVKRGDAKNHIIIINKCPSCSKNLRLFGGVID